MSIRTGANIFKPIALGAKAELVNRPSIYGLSIISISGAYAALAGLLADIDLTMGTAGVKFIADFTRPQDRRVHYLGDIKSSM